MSTNGCSIPLLLMMVVLAVGQISCSTSGRTSGSLSWGDPGIFNTPGFPAFELQGFPQSGDSTGIMIFIDASLETLVYVRTQGGFEAEALFEIQILRLPEELLSLETTWAETLFSGTYEDTRVRRTKSLERFLALGPGSYLVRVRLSDQNSQQSTVRSRNVVIPSFDAGHPGAGEIHVRVRNQSGSYSSFLGLHIPGPGPNLRCGIRVYSVDKEEILRLRFIVLKVESDSSLPSPPYALSPTRGSLEFSGIEMSRADTVFFGKQLITGERNEGEIFWDVSISERGAYVMIAGGEAFHDGKDDTVSLREAYRPIAPMSSGFPRPTTIDELLDATSFLLTESELDSIAKLQSSTDKTTWFERFWLSAGGTEDAAKDLIKQYYSRVEEANLRFSSFHEGWRTDRGMIYIVLGMPVTVQGGALAEIWNYSSGEGDKMNSYTFRKVALPDELGGFDHYVLERQPYYDQAWLAAVDRWRRGVGF